MSPINYINVDEERIQAFWNQLNARDRIELFKKVTGEKHDVKEVVNFTYPPKEIENWLIANPQEIKSKYQVYIKEYQGGDWEIFERPTFFLQLAFDWADKQFKEYSAYAVAVKDLMTEKLMAINY